MMEIRSCPRCRKPFPYMGNRFCRDCVGELDVIFGKVRNHLYEHPKASIDEIIEVSGADEEDVLQWIREGRLIMHADAASLIECENCGASIRSGRYCEDCTRSMHSQLASTAAQLEEISRKKEGVWTRSVLGEKEKK